MGTGIAQVAASSGCAVSLLDVSVARARESKNKIERWLQRSVDKAKIDLTVKENCLDLIQPTDEMGCIADCDIAIEAATENEEIKLKILADMSSHAGLKTILASNTSSISITKMADVTSRPEKVVGIHFMNPVPLMDLVEIVRSDQTSEATYETARSLVESFGKTVITSRDRPGFLVNRVLIPFLNEAVLCFAEGVGSAEDIDQGAKLGLKHPLGPLELADLIGLDTVLAIAQVLHRDFDDDKYRPAPLLQEYVDKGWLGRKSGRGFYSYDADGGGR